MRDHNLKKISFIMNTGKLLHFYGASSDRIEAALTKISEKLSIKGRFFAVPTGLFGSFKEENDIDDDDEITRLIRLEPGAINLSKLYHVDKIVDEVIESKISLKEGGQKLRQVELAKSLFNPTFEILAQGFIALSIAIILSGTYFDILISFFLGLVTGISSQFSDRTNYSRIHEMLTPFIITMVACLFNYYLFPINIKLVILAGILYLLPGLNLTTALQELASSNLTAGTGRFMGAIMTLLKLSFGVLLGFKFSGFIVDINQSILEEVSYSIPVLLGVMILASFSFVIAFQARIQDAPHIIILASAGHFINLYLLNYFTHLEAPFLTAFIISLLCNYASKIFNRPALIFLLPAIILLVPGSLGFKGLSFMHEENFIEGLNIAFQTVAIGISIVAGLFFGNLAISPKRTL